VLQDPVSAWAELIKRCRLPDGLTGLLIAVEVAAYTSTLSALINWGGSFVINDLYRPLEPHATPQREIWVSRVTTLILFLSASAVAVLFVKRWSLVLVYQLAMVIFLLPLSFFRFLWWRFNVWGELAAVVLGLPLSILVWFGLDFQNPARYPMWQGLGCCSAWLSGPGGGHAAHSRGVGGHLAGFYQRCARQASGNRSAPGSVSRCPRALWLGD